ncbi:MAG: hypothetical protein ACYDCE_16130 [Candidatus Acidiferrales bacterium]
MRTHRVHRWRVIAKEIGGRGRVLFGCGYGRNQWRGCIATYVHDPQRVAKVDARTMRAALRIFGNMIAGTEQTGWIK